MEVNRLVVKVQRVKRPGWYRHVIMALLALVTVLPASLVGGLSPEPAKSYTWGEWTPYLYFPVSTEECKFVKATVAKFVGPLQHPNPGCQQALRRRTATAVSGEALFQVENVGPFGGYGMSLESTVSWDGKTVHATEPICRTWAVIVKAEAERCAAIDNDSARLWLRMDYKASWGFLWVNVNAGRGATVDVSNKGWIGPVTRWP